MSSTSITCRELVDLITAYLDGALDSAQRDRFEHHVAKCTGCAEYLEQVRATVRAAGALREDTIDPAAREALLGAFRSWRARPA